jgi:hypothetical protein
MITNLILSFVNDNLVHPERLILNLIDPEKVMMIRMMMNE